jgi:hypothetical protein
VHVMNDIIKDIKESRGPTKVPMEIDHDILIMIDAKRLELQSKTYILEKVVLQRNRKDIKKALQLVKGVVAKLINIWNEGGEGNNGGKKSIYARARNWKPENRNAHGGTRKRSLNKNKTRKNKATKKDLQMLAKKYMVSPNGSTNEIANTLVELRGAAIKNKRERSIIEQFLKKSTPSTKRWGFVPLR